jgi:flagellar basal-body rod protein FlgF
MDSLLYTAMNGATRSLVQQQIRSNNLANANTQGFRADLERGVTTQVQGTGFDSRFLVAGRNGGVNMSEGAMQSTGRELDIAVQGAGLITLRGAGGAEVYTRNGNIDVDANGRLTIGGLPVIGDGGPIELPPFSAIDIGNDGTITIIPEDGNMAVAMDVDRIKLVDIPANQLRKNDEGMLVANRRTTARNENVKVVSQHLETSNVSAISEMVATVSLNRQFEAQIKMMKAAEDLAEAGNRLLRT